MSTTVGEAFENFDWDSQEANIFVLNAIMSVHHGSTRIIPVELREQVQYTMDSAVSRAWGLRHIPYQYVEAQSYIKAGTVLNWAWLVNYPLESHVANMYEVLNVITDDLYRAIMDTLNEYVASHEQTC